MIANILPRSWDLNLSIGLDDIVDVIRGAKREAPVILESIWALALLTPGDSDDRAVAWAAGLARDLGIKVKEPSVDDVDVVDVLARLMTALSSAIKNAPRQEATE